MDESKQEDSPAFDLKELTEFQFGPDWARAHDAAVGRRTYTEGHTPQTERVAKRTRRPRDVHHGNASTPGRPGSAPRDRQDADRRTTHNRTGRFGRPALRDLPQPAQNLRVEVRPCNPILDLFATQIQRSKRALSLIDLARVAVAKKSRYDLVFMRQEGGPHLIRSRRGDSACWLTEADALAYLEHAPWLAEYYSKTPLQVPPPKGAFDGVAVCDLGGEVVGPVNWHGYRPALTALYRTKYSGMSFAAFRASVNIKKEEQLMAQWLQQVTIAYVWHPTREGAQELSFDNFRAVQDDFRAHHYDEVYEITDKAFVNAATPPQLLSPGLAAHVSIISGKYFRNPQLIIPNLCHGLARHHMPIFKWHGYHYTGPSRIHAVPEGTVLADRMSKILEWAKVNSGKKADVMFAELSGVPSGTDEASKRAAADAYAPYTADMIWLMEQGFILVTNDNSVWFPKGEHAPAAVLSPRRGKQVSSVSHTEKTQPERIADTSADVQTSDTQDDSAAASVVADAVSVEAPQT